MVQDFFHQQYGYTKKTRTKSKCDDVGNNHPAFLVWWNFNGSFNLPYFKVPWVRLIYFLHPLRCHQRCHSDLANGETVQTLALISMCIPPEHREIVWWKTILTGLILYKSVDAWPELIDVYWMLLHKKKQNDMEQTTTLRKSTNITQNHQHKQNRSRALQISIPHTFKQKKPTDWHHRFRNHLSSKCSGAFVQVYGLRMSIKTHWSEEFTPETKRVWSSNCCLVLSIVVYVFIVPLIYLSSSLNENRKKSTAAEATHWHLIRGWMALEVVRLYSTIIISRYI